MVSTLKQRLYNYCEAHRDESRNPIIRHFVSKNVPVATVYRLVKASEIGIPAEREKGSGRKATIMTQKNIKRLENLITTIRAFPQGNFGENSTVTNPILLRQSEVRRASNTKREFWFRNVRRSRQRAFSRSVKKFRGADFILDDESYFTFKNTDKNANAGFWTRDVSTAPMEIKLKTTKNFNRLDSEFPQTDCPVHTSSHSGLAINKNIYLKECIIKRLIRFINKSHPDNNCVFWPDLASSHHAKKVVEYLTTENIAFVKKEDNPACVPELRPIEHFWSILKGMVYQNGWEAKTSQNLKNHITFCLKKMDPNLVQGMVGSVFKRLDRARRYGVKGLEPT